VTVADGLGFDLAWNLGWMHDTLTGLASSDGARVALPATYATRERWVLPLSHDEVVHGKRSLAGRFAGDRAARVAALRGLLGHMWAFPGAKLIFMGTESAPDTEWSEYRGLDWSAPEPGVAQLITDLNRLYRSVPALAPAAAFEWLAADRVAALLRSAPDGPLLVSVTDLTGAGVRDAPVPLPRAGRWVEVLNTDAHDYGGTGEGNLGAVDAAAVTVGPSATVWLIPG